MLVDTGKVEYKGQIGSSFYFSVISESTHQVLFRIKAEKWMCDCEFTSISEKDCSHILACKHWLNLKKNSKLMNKKEIKTESVK